MSPRPNTPKLAKIEPTDLARSVVAGLSDRLAPAATACGMSLQASKTEAPLFDAVAELVAFAKYGDFASNVDANLDTLAVAVDLSTLNGNPDALANDWNGSLTVVFRAVMARLRLAQAKSVAPADLACLTSTSASNVRLLVRRGKLRVDNKGYVLAEDARGI